MPSHNGKIAIGIDIGGTSIKSALISERGEILSKELTPIPFFDEENSVIKTILSIISIHYNSIINKKQLAGIGLGAPGNVNRKKGMIVDGAYNLPGINSIPLAKHIVTHFNLPFYIDNDATSACKGEFLFGAGKEYDHMILLTLGTGVGGGIILNRRVFHGVSDYAGEIGHMTLYPEGMLCSCGNRGCLEAYASATAMINYAKQAVKRNEDTKLSQIPLDQIDGKIIFQFAHEGDHMAIQIINNIGRYIAIGIGNIINLLNIPLVVIGGGLSEGGDILFQSINKHINDYILPPLKKTFEIKKALLGNDAGVIGAASAVFMEGETSY